MIFATIDSAGDGRVAIELCIETAVGIIAVKGALISSTVNDLIGTFITRLTIHLSIG